MCGLFGWIRHEDSTLTEAETLTLTQTLVMLNEGRGDDSIGLASFRQGESVPLVHRAVGAPTAYMISHREHLQQACRDGGGWLMGHTRAKTQGAVTVENAHPFTFGEVIGAHNGVLSNDALLARQVEADYTLPGCDSAVLFALADKIGMKKALAQTTGSLNLTWTEAPYTHINLYQSTITGISVVYVPAWRTLLWSSEDEPLRLACAMLGVSVEYDEKGEAPGYYTALPVSTIAKLTTDRLTDECGWDEDAAPSLPYVYTAARRVTPYNCGYGYGALDVEALPDPDTAYQAQRGFHPSRLQVGIFHRGKQRTCKRCTDYSASRYGAEHGQAQLPSEIDDMEQILVIPPSGMSRVITGIWPPLACPNCGKRLEKEDGIWTQDIICKDCHSQIEIAPAEHETMWGD